MRTRRPSRPRPAPRSARGPGRRAVLPPVSWTAVTLTTAP